MKIKSENLAKKISLAEAKSSREVKKNATDNKLDGCQLNHTQKKKQKQQPFKFNQFDPAWICISFPSGSRNKLDGTNLLKGYMIRNGHSLFTWHRK